MKTLAIFVGLACLLLGVSGHERKHATPLEIHWMNETIQFALSQGGPCSFAPFVAIAVNRTSNTVMAYGAGDPSDPSGHGEINAIRQIVANSNGQAGAFDRWYWQQIDLYTTGEPCPMCEAAIRWAGFHKVVYATSIPSLIDFGWPQIPVRAKFIDQKSNTNSNADGYFSNNPTELVAYVLDEVTDPLFAWQFDASAACPTGCSRQGGFCAPN